ncbi:MAG: alginate export family protein, partial [Planctomycetales bacterium]|nr:alginate export family protein [Planctomycetales bacterium]
MPVEIATGGGLGSNVSFITDVAPVAYMDCCEPSGLCVCGEGCGCGDECGCGDTCGCGGGKGKNKKPNPCAASHKGVFYANDFSYLEKDRSSQCLGDCMKQMPMGHGTVDIGGQLRLRYHHEEGMGRQAGASGFQGTKNDFMLTRLRLYLNYKANDWLRFYVEGISAEALANDAYIPRPIDRNSGDFLNLFFDAGLTESTTFRIGRQELLYGAQRAISPLDWGNTRRTFEGVNVIYKGDDWDVDGFYTHYVPVSPFDLDEADYKQAFYGVYATYKSGKTAIYDLFYIGYDNTNSYTGAAPAINAANAGTADFSLHTFGGRIFSDKGDWLFELEGAYQTGRQSGLGLDHRAGMCTCGVGRKLGDAWSPVLWAYYDYASGNDEADGVYNRYNQLFPLAHKYLGFIDAVARSNVSAPNCLLTMKPTDKL